VDTRSYIIMTPLPGTVLFLSDAIRTFSEFSPEGNFLLSLTNQLRRKKLRIVQ